MTTRTNPIATVNIIQNTLNISKGITV